MSLSFLLSPTLKSHHGNSDKETSGSVIPPPATAPSPRGPAHGSLTHSAPSALRLAPRCMWANLRDETERWLTGSGTGPSTIHIHPSIWHGRGVGVQCWGTAAAFVIANEMEGGKVSPFLPRMNADDATVEWWDARDGRELTNRNPHCYRH